MSEEVAPASKAKEASIRLHVSIYLTFALFFLILNLLTDPFHLWFYWPLLGWGLFLALHAFAVYGADAPVKLLELVQSIVTRLSAASTVQPPRAGAAPATPDRTASSSPREEVPVSDSLHQVIADGETRADAMRERARRIRKPAVRDQALRLSASADRILAVLAEDPDHEQLARDFVDRYLAPAEAIVTRYARLAARDVSSAAPTLAKVETEDLPLLDQKMTALYDRLHRGDLIDLEVAREMLAFDFPTAPAAVAAEPEPRGGSADPFSGLLPRRQGHH